MNAVYGQIYNKGVCMWMWMWSAQNIYTNTNTHTNAHKFVIDSKCRCKFYYVLRGLFAPTLALLFWDWHIGQLRGEAWMLLDVFVLLLLAPYIIFIGTCCTVVVGHCDIVVNCTFLCNELQPEYKMNITSIIYYYNKKLSVQRRLW